MPRRKPVQRSIPPRENIYAVPEFRPLAGPHNAVLVPRVVEDPYRNKEKDEYETSTVMADIRHCPLGKAYAEGRIDTAEWEAGLTWLGFYELATIGDLKGFELKTPVDGAGAFPEFMSDRRKKAIGELSKAKREIGERAHNLLTEVLGNRRFITELAESLGHLDDYGKPLKRMVFHLYKMFKAALEDLAILYGKTSKPNGIRKRI